MKNLEREYYVDWSLKEGSNESVTEEGRFLAAFDGDYFTIETVYGNMPYMQVIKEFLDDDRVHDWITSLREKSLQYSNEYRKHPYKVLYREGSSGCLDIYIGSRIGINYIRKHHLCHISMNDKLNRGVRAPLIDVFILWAIIRNYDSWNDGEFSIKRIEETVPQGAFYDPLEVPDFYSQAEGYEPSAILEEEV